MNRPERLRTHHFCPHATWIKVQPSFLQEFICLRNNMNSSERKTFRSLGNYYVFAEKSIFQQTIHKFSYRNSALNVRWDGEPRLFWLDLHSHVCFTSKWTMLDNKEIIKIERNSYHMQFWFILLCFRSSLLIAVQLFSDIS